MGLPETLNQYLPRHWKQEGLDWGWVACIWLSYIISQGDHRKVRVREWVEQRRYTKRASVLNQHSRNRLYR